MRKVWFFLPLLLITGGMVFATNEYARPSHPIKPLIGQPRILADTIFVKYTSDDINYEITSAIIKRSKDGLRDTFYYSLPYTVYRVEVYKYDLNNRLSELRSTFFGTWHVIQEYEYDSSGRLTRLAEWSVPGIFENYDYSTIVYSDSSYTLNQVEYVFNSEEYLIRAGGITYSYFENGYEEILGSHEKRTYHFLENGYLSKRTFYQRVQEEGEWLKKESWETDYRYKDDNPHNPTGNIVFKTTSLNVYGTDGAAVILSDNPVKVRIFSIIGTLVRDIQTASSCQSIHLPKGIYLVMIEGKTYKIMVR